MQTGPFVDANHQKLKIGDVTQTPLELFHDVFLEPLRTLLDAKPGSIALLVPSVRDILSDHAVLPQSELALSLIDDPVRYTPVQHNLGDVCSYLLALDQRVHLLPNPTKFSLDGRSFAVTSVDVLFHVKKEELTKRGDEVEPTHFPTDETGTDAFAAVCRHVLRQRRFVALLFFYFVIEPQNVSAFTPYFPSQRISLMRLILISLIWMALHSHTTPKSLPPTSLCFPAATSNSAR
jgi:DNA polymerase alpha subunit B